MTDFKQEAVRLKSEGASMREIAKQLGCSTFRVWEALNPDKAAARRGRQIEGRRSVAPRANVVRRQQA